MRTATITSQLPTMTPRARTTVLAVLAALCTLGIVLAVVPAAQAAIVYNVKSFQVENGFGYPQGVAVDQSDNHVYVADLGEGLFEYESLGAPVLPRPFAAVGYFPTGVAVDPVNRNVYAYNWGTQEIDTFEPSPSRGEVRHFTVTGVKYKAVQIASDVAGDIYYPNQMEHTVEEFAPEAKEGEDTPVLTIKPTGAEELVEPKGVAVDSAHEKVYVVDSGNGGATPGRVQVFNKATGAYESTLDEGGSQDVAVDPVSGDVFVLDLNSEGSCAPLSAPCYRVRAYHTGATTPFAEFGEGTIATGVFPDRLAVDHHTGDVYVAADPEDESQRKVWIFEPILAPAASTEPATGVSATLTGAEGTLNGAVNPEGSKTSYHFEYGTSTEYGKSVPVPGAALGEGTQAIKVSQVLAGLEGSTTYHFRVVAETSSGIATDGADELFTTPALAPVIAGESVSGVTPTGAQFEALVNPESQETTYHFEYATNPQLTGATVLGSAVIPAEGQSVPVGQGASGLQPGTTYYYRVVAENATPPATDGPIQSFTTVGEPLAMTGAAADLTRTSAMLAGTVDPVGAETSYRFVYIDQARYEAALAEGAADPYADGWSTPAVKLAASYEAEAAGPVTVGGLLAGTTYHYALVASNEVGEAVGSDETFTTSAPTPPVVMTGAASGVGANAASLSATIETEGLPAGYGFEIGVEAGVYGPATGLGSVGAGLAETVTLSLQNLQPGTTYHYRVEASNVDGVAYGADQSFTTPGLPAPLGLPVSLPLIAAPNTAFPTEETGTTTPTTNPKKLTRAQRLANALKACAKKSKRKRAGCERQARKRYGPAARKAKGRRR